MWRNTCARRAAGADSVQSNLRADDVSDPIHDRLARLLSQHPLRAGQFIVTIYGDVVAPRNDALWIGDLIGLCAPLGISETLVRTAMSRLVAAGQMEGARKGRRSYYRLSESARAEFGAAARIIYTPDNPATWRFLWFADPQAAAQEIDAAQGALVALTPNLVLGPERLAAPERAVAFTAEAEGARSLLNHMAATLWPLEALARAYGEFLELTSPLADAATRADPETALMARLLLVHWFRAVALQDPNLPADALPQGWIGTRARARFATLYLSLSEAADSHIAANLHGATGLLPRQSPALKTRYRALQALASAETATAIKDLPKASQNAR